MRIVIQRVSRASVSVSVSGEEISSIGRGLMVLVGVEHGDTEADARWLADKTAQLRVFADDNGVMNRSVIDTGAEVMAVSQFTLTASTRKGNRPSYTRAAGHETATALYDLYAAAVEERTGRPTAKGIFGADMQVSLVNDGPVTIIIDSKLRE